MPNYRNHLLIFLMAFLVGCTTELSGSDTIQGTSGSELPAYIEYVYPRHDRTIDFEDYENSFGSTRGVGFKLFPTTLEPSPIPVQGSLIKGSPALYIDEELISNNTMNTLTGGMLTSDSNEPTVTYDAGPLWYSWLPDVSIGRHSARIVFTSTLDVQYEHTWSFEITE